MSARPPAPARWHTDAAARSHVGRVRKENQDAFGVFTDLGFFVVADGLGGHKAGEVASRMAVDTLRATLESTDDDDLTPVTDPRGSSSIGGRRLVIAVEEANRRIRDASHDPTHAGMGSTVAAVLFDDRYGVVAVCHVGDSRVFRVRGGAVEQLTEDHTVVQQWVREGRMGAEEAKTSPHRHMITQALGTQEMVRPGLRLERPEPGDVFVLTSDGVHDLVRPEEIGRVVVETGGDLERTCTRLVELANERGGRDNSTAVAVRCDPP
jgi:serine/threonine protein phosphatase PrpC